MTSLSTQNLNLTYDRLTVLEKALDTAQDLLDDFSFSENFSTDIRYIFGSQIEITTARAVFQALAQPDAFSLKIVASKEIDKALGSYSQTTNTVYLSQELLERNLNNYQAIAAVLLEETGHYIDARLNSTDTPGDEGELFAAKVQGKTLDAATENRIAQEDDRRTVTLDGQEVRIEQATPGVNPAFDLIGLTQLRNDPQFVGIDGSGVSAAIIDTGLDRTHPLLQPNYRTGVDFVNGGDNPVDGEGHGTHVSGTVGAADENIGVAPQAGLIGLQVFQSGGGASNSTIESALEWVYDNHQQYNIVVVNMSLGSGFYSSPGEVQGDILSDDIRRLEEVGVTVVTAAGNSYKNNEYPNFAAPAIYSTLAVGAVWQDGTRQGIQFGSGAIDYTTGTDRVTSFSQRLAANNTIFAPGALINSTVPGGGQALNAGTSMASPHVAGAVALMQEAALQFGGRLLSPAEVVEIMRGTADTIFDGDDEDDNVQNTNVSYPRLNIYRAVAEIKNRFGNNAPPPPGGDAGDSNGTIAGAIIGPTLDGSPVSPLSGSIGFDGATTDIGGTDVDIFRFGLASPGTVTISLGSHPTNPADFNSLLRLFDVAGNEIAFNDDNGSSQFSSLQANLEAGTYYVGISGYNNRNYNPTVAGSGTAGDIGNYSLQFSLGNADPNGLISGAVDVNLGSDREPLNYGGYIGFDYGAPVGVSDVDLFKIVVPDNGTLSIDVDTPYGEYVDSYLRVFDANGNPLVASDDDLFEGNEFTDTFSGLILDDTFNGTLIDGSFDAQGIYQPGNYGHETDSFISGTVTRGEVYYIGVSDYFNSDYDATTLNGRQSGGTGGNYELEITFVNNDLNGSITQAVSDATLPIVNRAGAIGTDGDSEVGDKDVDFVRVRSATAGILEVDITSSSLDPVDSVAFIFDGNGNQLAFDDDTDDIDPLIQYQIAANQDYYVAITGYGNEHFDPFALGSGTGGDTGEYTFNSRLLPLSQALSLSDNTVNSGAVQTIGFYQTLFGEIGKDGGFVTGATDVDIYRFTSPITGRVEIRVDANEESGADTFLRLFDSNGFYELAVNDNEASNIRGSVLQVDLVAGTTYLLGVDGASPQARDYNPISGTGAGPGSQGTYNITVQQAIDPAQYGASYPDLIVAYRDNLTALRNHFQTIGRFEGRNPDTFDELRYLASNPDLILAFGFNPGAATLHYLQSGYFEGRSLTAFDANQYLASYGDLIGVFGYNLAQATQHYIQSGIYEGRSTDAFDELRYLASNRDLIQAYGFNPAAATQHYISNGYREGRSLTSFAADRYLASNGDLIRTFGYNLLEATNHYINFGVAEGRSATTFNAVNYLNRYSDLQAIFGGDLTAATRHFIEHGFSEGRSDV